MSVQGIGVAAPAAINVQTLREAPIEKAVEAAVELALDAVLSNGLNVHGPQSGPVDSRAFANTLATFTSPEAILFHAQSQLQQTSADQAISDSKAADRKAETAEAKRMRQLDKALKALRKKNKRPKWLRKLVKALVSVVAAAVSVFSGGALGGVAIAGMVMMFAGDHIVKALVKLGVVPAKAAVWVSLALKLAGGVMMAAAGAQGVADAAKQAGQAAAQGGKAAASATKSVAQITAEVQKYVSYAVSAAEITVDGHTAKWNHKLGKAEIAQAKAAFDRDAAVTEMEQAVDAFKESFERFGRVSARVYKMADANDQARMASTRLLA